MLWGRHEEPGKKLQGLSCLISMCLSSSASPTVQMSERAVCYRAIVSLLLDTTQVCSIGDGLALHVLESSSRICHGKGI